MHPVEILKKFPKFWKSLMFRYLRLESKINEESNA